MVDPSYVVTVFLVACSARELLATERTEDTLTGHLFILKHVAHVLGGGVVRAGVPAFIG